MKNAVSANALTVLNYLKENEGADLTAQDIATALDMERKSVDGIVTAGLQKKKLTTRVPAQVEVEDEDGNTKYVDVKFIKITAEGLAYDHAAAIEADVKAAQA